MLAIEFVKDRSTKHPDAEVAQRVIEDARDHGLLLLTCGPHKNVVRLLPPLTATPEDIARGLDMLDRAVHEAVG